MHAPSRQRTHGLHGSNSSSSKFIHTQHPGRRAPCLSVCAKGKGKGGPQKNEGVYFEYRDVENTPEPIKDKETEKREFSWVQQARGSVRQYQHASQASTKRQKQQQQQQEQRRKQQGSAQATGQQQQQQQQEEDAAPVPEPPHTSHPATPDGADASQPTTIPSDSVAADPVGSSSSSSSSPRSGSSSQTLLQRKQQLLQRMKGAPAAPGGTGSMAAATDTAGAGTAAGSPALATTTDFAAGTPPPSPKKAAAAAAAAVADAGSCEAFSDALAAAAATAAAAASPPSPVSVPGSPSSGSSEASSPSLPGAAAAATQLTATPAAPSPVATPSAAEAKAAATAAAAAAGAGSSLRQLELDGEAGRLLDELMDMAQELSEGPDGLGFSSFVDNDPLDDPLAALFAAADVNGGSNGSSNVSSNGSNGGGAPWQAGVAADVDVDNGDTVDAAAAAFAAELAAARETMQELLATSGVGDGPAEQQVVRTAELLAWEAEHAAATAAKLTVSCDRAVASMEAAMLAVQQEELRDDDGGDNVDGDEDASDDEYAALSDSLFGDYDEDGEDDKDNIINAGNDSSWLEADPQLKRLLAADEASFAKLLQDMGDEEEEDGISGSNVLGATTAENADSWSHMGLDDWVDAAAASATATAAQPSEAAAAAAAAGGSSGSDGGGLGDVMSAIDKDPSLDDRAKMEAKLRIAGVFNQQDAGAAAAVAAAAAVVKRRSSSSSRSSSGSSDQVGDDSSAAAPPALLPRPMRPKV